MKKIFQIIFSKMNTRTVEQEIKSPEIYRRLADTPDSIPGERTDLHKRQLTSAPVDFDVAPGRI